MKKAPAAAKPVVFTAPRMTTSEETIVPVRVDDGPGMRIFMDPETGMVGPPTPEALRELAQAEPMRAMPEFQKVTLPDGSIMVDLQGWYQESMVMTIDKNGKRVVRCGNETMPAGREVSTEPVREDR